jgi:[acyl-carrier-protein] S-malonyltransferase
LIDQSVTAFIFPGQGSQFVGMGSALAAQFPVAAQTFEEADDLLSFSLSKLCFDGPEDDLTHTLNAQPALYTCGIAALRTLYEAWNAPFQPAFTAGHSLGELTALTAAGALSFPDGLKLVRRRGELMRDAGQHSPGGMTALLGLDLNKAQTVCAEATAKTGGIVVVANDNCPSQLVIAGDEKTLALATGLATAAGAKRAVRIPVSIAAHSPLMARVASDFNAALESTLFHEPILPIIGNIKASPLTTVSDIREELGAQLTSPVRWTESIQSLLARGVNTFVELGSKNVLIGLLKRIDKTAATYAVDSPEGINALL